MSEAGAPITLAAAGHFMVTHDAVGPKVLELVDGRYDEASIEVVDLGTSGLALLDRLRGQRLLIVVDACIGQGEPGELIEQTYDAADTPPSRETSVHQLGPIAALQIAKELYPEQLPQRTVLLLVDTTGADDTLVNEASGRVVERLDELIGAESFD